MENHELASLEVNTEERVAHWMCTCSKGPYRITLGYRALDMTMEQHFAKVAAQRVVIHRSNEDSKARKQRKAQ